MHESLEQRVAAFCGVERAIAFSDSASCTSSTIAAFAKRGDLVIFDEAISEPLRTGVLLSRASALSYKHCDMVDLESVLASVVEDDRETRRRSSSVVFLLLPQTHALEIVSRWTLSRERNTFQNWAGVKGRAPGTQRRFVSIDRRHPKKEEKERETKISPHWRGRSRCVRSWGPVYTLEECVNSFF